MISLPANPHSIEAKELLRQLGSREDGISGEESQKRLQEFGPNEIPDAGRKPIWKIVLKQFNNLMVYILLAAALISFFTKHYVDVYVILAIIIINAIIGFVQEYKAEGALIALKNLLVPQCKVIRNGGLQTVNSRELVPGDIIALEEGDNIPADARVIYAKNARTSEASLTGESVPVTKTSDTLFGEIPLAEKSNMVWKGTFLAGGSIKAVVTGTGLKTQIGEIATSILQIEPKKTNFQNKTDKLARQMALIAIASAVVLFVVAYFFNDFEINEILLISIASLVSAIPEGLPAVLSIVMAVGSHRMSKNNAIIREITATESLGSVSTIVTDKTGTLTQNTMTIKKVWVPNAKEVDVLGEGWESEGELSGQKEDIEAIDLLLEIASHCHNSAIQEDDKGMLVVTGDPTEAAFLVLGNKAGKSKDHTILEDVAFNSDIKYRSTLVEKGEKKIRFYIGAPESISEICSSIKLSDGETKTLDDAEKSIINEKISSWSKESLRVLALAIKEEHTGSQSDQNLEFIGLAGMMDPPRPGVYEAVKSCHLAGIRVIMATGDHADTALAIAKSVGIVKEGREKVYTDSDLSKMSQEAFDLAVQESDVFCRLTPVMKLNIAKSLQKQGELIAMTGDGVNDAPALKQANIGISMGILGTDVAKDASMMVLADDNFATIVKAIEQGRIVFNNARRTSFFLISTNFAEILILILAVSFGLPMPLTATQILWINLVTDGFCDKALAAEQGKGNELQSPPIDPKENILNKSVYPFLIINTLLMTGISLTAYLYYLPESLEKARTIVFITMAFSQLFNVLNMRNLEGSTFKIGLFSNKWVNYSLLISILLQIIIIEIPSMATLFKFIPITFWEFIFWAGITSLVFWITEVFKYFRFK
ncbi:cation-translocating P-type ATPase [Cognataquiflexum aquatile]|uniref:cation-translocating P-type ATPase n=1 Tax=Cognataquiflexum aquatile TaxID=2249427 RepID=UPI000DE8DAE5|nr:HAD-IC family P-type ATPase [Cognataquiflexum aquatile]